MKYFSNFFVGILIGCGAILPGVSSGVFCVIFGIYEKLVNSILNFFKDLKNNLSFLLPIGIGSFIGVVLFGNIIKYFFNTFRMPACFAFMGLILGTIPALFSEATCNNKCICFKKLLPMFLSFFVGIALIIIENKFNFDYTIYNIASNPIYLIFAGFIMSIGIVVPGISNTILLMCLGVYPTYISAIASVDLSILIPMGIGILIGSLIWLKLINFLLTKYHSATFLSIIGFTLGSVFVLYPGFTFDIVGLISIFCFVICIIVSYKL